MTVVPIRAKDRDAVIQSLRAGVVPRTGQYLVQVGRAKELAALLQEITRIANEGSAFKLVVGEYGAGKTFFLNLVRSIAMEKRLVTMHADLNPDRRLQATGGQARSLYAELTKNISTRTKPDGGALPGIVEKFIAHAKSEATASGQTSENVIRAKLACLTELVNGYDFSDVIAAYCRGFEEDKEQLKIDAIRWLRGEFSTKTDARNALGVRTIIDDASIYDQLKLLARFVRLAGYGGLMVCLDEMVNLYKLANKQARDANYEQILRMLNDSLQGSSQGLGLVLGGTPEFLMDTRKGLYSYPALQSRLMENAFARPGLIDYAGPVMRLSSLTHEDFYVLLCKLRDVYSFNNPEKHLLPDEAIPAFMQHCAKRLGEAYFRTPRTTITAFISLLAVLEQNPDADWKDLIGATDIAKDTGGDADFDLSPDDGEDELVSIRTS
ncbi:MAG: ATP-binding protein [Alphaproteobacteria bacterium]|nr:ATP-binding protein [Alphaproteobacteria bacterium]